MKYIGVSHKETYRIHIAAHNKNKGNRKSDRMEAASRELARLLKASERSVEEGKEVELLND